MSTNIKVGPGSICPSCEAVPDKDQCVRCFLCKCSYHASCDILTVEANLGSKTMVKTFLSQSTKGNFKFFCDKCLTDFEISFAKTQGLETMGNNELVQLEKKVDTLEAKLDEITALLKTSADSSTSKVAGPPDIWANEEKMKTVRLPPKSILLFKNNGNITPETESNIEKTVLTNKIGISRSYKNINGDLVVVCNNNDTRNNLKDAISDDLLEMQTPTTKRTSITIVGLRTKYTTREVFDMLIAQNPCFENFSSLDMNDHIEIVAVRELKNNPTVFQAFAKLSDMLRGSITQAGNRLVVGLSSCRVYDQFYIKRCYNCQHFDHYAKDCPTPHEHVCGKCSSNHPTKACDSDSDKCVNCVRDGVASTNHKSGSSDCPCIIKHQQLIKTKQAERLNSLFSNLPPPR